MCVGAPMQVIEVRGLMALCASAAGLEEIDTALLGEVAPGEHLLTHLGVATRRLDEAEARAIADALAAVRLAAHGLPFEHLIADLAAREPQLPPHLQAQHARETNDRQNESKTKKDRGAP